MGWIKDRFKEVEKFVRDTGRVVGGRKDVGEYLGETFINSPTGPLGYLGPMGLGSELANKYGFGRDAAKDILSALTNRPEMPGGVSKEDFDKEKKDAEAATIGYLNAAQRYQTSLDQTNNSLNPVDYLRGSPVRPMIFLRPDGEGGTNTSPKNTFVGGPGSGLPQRRNYLL